MWCATGMRISFVSWAIYLSKRFYIYIFFGNFSFFYKCSLTFLGYKNSWHYIWWLMNFFSYLTPQTFNFAEVLAISAFAQTNHCCTCHEIFSCTHLCLLFFYSSLADYLKSQVNITVIFSSGFSIIFTTYEANLSLDGFYWEQALQLMGFGAFYNCSGVKIKFDFSMNKLKVLNSARHPASFSLDILLDSRFLWESYLIINIFCYVLICYLLNPF